MDIYSQSQVFFFISSVGFVFLWILAAIFLYYLIRVTSALSRITDKFEKNINDIGDVTKELIDDMRENIVFKFLFGKREEKSSV